MLWRAEYAGKISVNYESDCMVKRRLISACIGILIACTFCACSGSPTIFHVSVTDTFTPLSENLRLVSGSSYAQAACNEFEDLQNQDESDGALSPPDFAAVSVLTSDAKKAASASVEWVPIRDSMESLNVDLRSAENETASHVVSVGNAIEGDITASQTACAELLATPPDTVNIGAPQRVVVVRSYLSEGETEVDIRWQAPSIPHSYVISDYQIVAVPTQMAMTERIPPCLLQTADDLQQTSTSATSVSPEPVSGSYRLGVFAQIQPGNPPAGSGYTPTYNGKLSALSRPISFSEANGEGAPSLPSGTFSCESEQQS